MHMVYLRIKAKFDTSLFSTINHTYQVNNYPECMYHPQMMSLELKLPSAIHGRHTLKTAGRIYAWIDNYLIVHFHY